MFSGPIYLRPEETNHEPVRNFHFKEIILSAQEQTFPLAHIRGRCCVLVKPDYQCCRPVNITENHVYYQEQRWQIDGISRLTKKSESRDIGIPVILNSYSWDPKKPKF